MTGADISLGWYVFGYHQLTPRRATPTLFSLFVLNEKDHDEIEMEKPANPANRAAANNNAWGKLRFKPILQVGNSADQIGGDSRGQSVIFAVIERDKGLFVLDGTGLGLGTGAFGGNSYDWPKVYRNILNYRSNSDEPQTTELPHRPLREVPSQFSFSAYIAPRDKKDCSKTFVKGTVTLSWSQLKWADLTLQCSEIKAVQEDGGGAFRIGPAPLRVQKNDTLVKA